MRRTALLMTCLLVIVGLAVGLLIGNLSGGGSDPAPRATESTVLIPSPSPSSATPAGTPSATLATPSSL